MAERPVFMPRAGTVPGVVVARVAFKWHAGLSAAQKRRNVDALHAAFQERFPGTARPLEISSRSSSVEGAALSAFRLGVRSVKAGGFVSVESLYQASKVFERAGPFPAFYTRSARDARACAAAHGGEPLVAFELYGERWPLQPPRAFYTWLYCHALRRNTALAAVVGCHDAFTDIEFNPNRSVNCQAFAAAYYLSLLRCGRLAQALVSQEAFLKLMGETDEPALERTAPSRGVRLDKQPTRARARGRRKPGVVRKDATPEKEVSFLDGLFPGPAEPSA